MNAQVVDAPNIEGYGSGRPVRRANAAPSIAAGLFQSRRVRSRSFVVTGVAEAPVRLPCRSGASLALSCRDRAMPLSANRPA
jgi:hypothetical protein